MRCGWQTTEWRTCNEHKLLSPLRMSDGWLVASPTPNKVTTCGWTVKLGACLDGWWRGECNNYGNPKKHKGNTFYDSSYDYLLTVILILSNYYPLAVSIGWTHCRYYFVWQKVDLHWLTERRTDALYNSFCITSDIGSGVVSLSYRSVHQVHDMYQILCMTVGGLTNYCSISVIQIFHSGWK